MIDPAARIHPSADLEADVTVGPGTSIWQRAQVRTGARIGAECVIGLGGLAGASVLVLGLTYRAGVKELAYSGALRVIRSPTSAGAEVHAQDPLLSAGEVAALGVRPWVWGDPARFRAIIVQTADQRFDALDAAWFPELQVIVDGRNSLRGLKLPAGVAYVGFGVRRTAPTQPHPA